VVQSEGYSECDGHRLGMYLPERLGFVWRRCTYRGLSGWGRAAHDGTCENYGYGYGNDNCSHLSRVGSGDGDVAPRSPAYGIRHAVKGRRLHFTMTTGATDGYVIPGNAPSY